MADNPTTVKLGMLPVNRGEYSSSNYYYKDNIVQYNGSSYIYSPANFDIDDPAASKTSEPPYYTYPDTLNTGWYKFATGNNTFTTHQQVEDLGIDSVPTDSSTNLVTSGGVYNAIDNVAFSTNEKINTIGIDSAPTAGSQNLVTSGGVKEEIDDAVEGIESQINNVTNFQLNWTDDKLLATNGAVVDASGGYAGKCSTTDAVSCSDYQGKTISLSHGYSTCQTRFIFYAGNAGILDSYQSFDNIGVASISVPSTATSFRVGVYSTSSDTLAPTKSAVSVKYSEQKFIANSAIADNLTTDDATKVLSAKQGKILNDKHEELAEAVEEIISKDTETILFTLNWNDDKLLVNNGGVNDASGGYLNKCSTTDPVSCVQYAGANLQVEYGVETTYLCFYNSNSQMVDSRLSYTGTGKESVAIPSTAASFRICVHTPTSADNLSLSKAAVKTSVTIKREIDEGVLKPKLFSQQLFGAVDYAMPTDFDYPQLLFFGQSFAQGGSSMPVDTDVIPNCYMYGDTVKDIRANQTFNPLKLEERDLEAEQPGETYEFPVVSCANALSNMYRRYGIDLNIVASTGGASGTTIQTEIAHYVVNVVNMHTRMKAAADALNKTVGCFAIVFMQGESDYGVVTPVPDEEPLPDKDDYKAKLLVIKNMLQQSAIDNLGQTRKPLFFIYQTSGNWVKNYEGIDNKELGVSMAQIEFAEENDDVILISPAYQVTRYTDGHPSSNGYRWLGEYYAKAIWQTLYRGWRFSNPHPVDYVRNDDSITIYVSSCILPLQINTWTLPQKTNYGFKVEADGTNVGIKSVELENNAIVLKLSTSIKDATTVSVTYGGVGLGAGNICDSDSWNTWFKYLSDANDDGYDGTRTIGQYPTTESGGTLVGKNYPMNNFLTIFYKEL